MSWRRKQDMLNTVMAVVIAAIVLAGAVAYGFRVANDQATCEASGGVLIDGPAGYQCYHGTVVPR